MASLTYNLICLSDLVLLKFTFGPDIFSSTLEPLKMRPRLIQISIILAKTSRFYSIAPSATWLVRMWSALLTTSRVCLTLNTTTRPISTFRCWRVYANAATKTKSITLRSEILWSKPRRRAALEIHSSATCSNRQTTNFIRAWCISTTINTPKPLKTLIGHFPLQKNKSNWQTRTATAMWNSINSHSITSVSIISRSFTILQFAKCYLETLPKHWSW